MYRALDEPPTSAMNSDSPLESAMERSVAHCAHSLPPCCLQRISVLLFSTPCLLPIRYGFHCDSGSRPKVAGFATVAEAGVRTGRPKKDPDHWHPFQVADCPLEPPPCRLCGLCHLAAHKMHVANWMSPLEWLR